MCRFMLSKTVWLPLNSWRKRSEDIYFDFADNVFRPLKFTIHRAYNHKARRCIKRILSFSYLVRANFAVFFFLPQFSKWVIFLLKFLSTFQRKLLISCFRFEYFIDAVAAIFLVSVHLPYLSPAICLPHMCGCKCIHNIGAFVHFEQACASFCRKHSHI